MKWQRALAVVVILPLLFGCTTARVKILSTPSDASVFIDGELAGATPLELRLKKRTHRIRVEKQGYTPIVDHISPLHKDDVTLTLLFFPLYWIFASDFQYTFREVYDYDLEPSRIFPSDEGT